MERDHLKSFYESIKEPYSPDFDSLTEDYKELLKKSTSFSLYVLGASLSNLGTALFDPFRPFFINLVSLISKTKRK